MERLNGGSLADFVLYRKRLHNPLTEKECKVLMRQILGGLNYLHEKDLLHRDLKPANLLMKSCQVLENSIKIADFGLCTQLRSDSCWNPSERCGTRSYMAPEQIQGQRYCKVE
jgi:serine/threonine protein kinase